MKPILKVVIVVLGATGGYLYYHFIGCASGTCPITSNPWISTFYGALIGFILVLGRKNKRKSAEKTEGTN